jgi:hypothetical protein
MIFLRIVGSKLYKGNSSACVEPCLAYVLAHLRSVSENRRTRRKIEEGQGKESLKESR